MRTSLPLPAGESVTLGLRNGLFIPAIVGMHMGVHVSLLFDDQVDISTVIAEQSNGRGEREAVRLNIAMPVTVSTLTGLRSCMMEDISLFGVKILDDSDELHEHMQAQISIEGLGKRDAMVRWRQDAHVGLSFKVALSFKILDQWAVQIMP